MWLFTRYGFFSVSVDRLGNLAVRARCRKHLQNLVARFPKINRAKIIVTKKADYHYRIFIFRGHWLEVVTELVAEQTWGNFKQEAERFNKDPIYKHALHNIWYEMVQSGQEWEEQ